MLWQHTNWVAEWKPGVSPYVSQFGIFTRLRKRIGESAGEPSAAPSDWQRHMER